LALLIGPTYFPKELSSKNTIKKAQQSKKITRERLFKKVISFFLHNLAEYTTTIVCCYNYLHKSTLNECQKGREKYGERDKKKKGMKSEENCCNT
jgi:hypothetical protein